MENLMSYLNPLIENVILFAPKLLSAIAILVIGFWLIKKVHILLETALHRINFDAAITSFLISMAEISMKVVVILIAAGVIGFELAGLMGIMAGAAFAIGLALQGSLSNFAAGILIVVFKPYKVGDWVEIQEKFGKVEEIQIFNTIIATPGMKTLIIPNGQVIDGVVTNFSKKGFIRLELTVTMPYAESFPKVEKIIREVLSDTPGVLPEPLPEIGIESYDSHNLIVAVRPYVTPDNYWEVTFEVHRRIKAAFSSNNIAVAYSEGVEMGKIGE
ncbi:MAG: mechanosensitive ion channel [Calditrichaeota bacterium]|nr:mechanosensitive ion channel [Calditrichota bacterium]MCB0269399.1 mechanosensitive ion channel [Calditrichota bacterium]